MKTPWAQNPNIVGIIYGTLIKAHGVLIRFLHVCRLLASPGLLGLAVNLTA